jgi:hypothetical protein
MASEYFWMLRSQPLKDGGGALRDERRFNPNKSPSHRFFGMVIFQPPCDVPSVAAVTKVSTLTVKIEGARLVGNTRSRYSTFERRPCAS